MKFNIHAGHNPSGKVACGAVGLINESREAREVKNYVVSMLQNMGHTVYDCTVDNGKTQNDVLKKIVAKCNEHTVDFDISIHFNSGRNDYSGDGVLGGVECFVYSNSGDKAKKAKSICEYISKLGYKNRGVKTSTNLYVLKHTNAPAILIECCFVDDADDIKLYNAKSIAESIVSGLTGVVPVSGTMPSNNTISYFKVKITTDELNIRSNPTTLSAIVGKVNKNEVYTITETKGSWGKLKSGAGWISISTKYVKYL